MGLISCCKILPCLIKIFQSCMHHTAPVQAGEWVVCHQRIKISDCILPPLNGALAWSTGRSYGDK